MQARCEYSELTVPIDGSYVAVAVAYVDEISKKLGFEEDQRKKIALAVEQTVANVRELISEPGGRQNFEISCERIPAGLRVIIKERGMPFDPSRIPLFQPRTEDRQEPLELPDIPLLRDLVDEFSIHNLGPDGQEIHLVKYLRDKSVEDYFQACELEQFQEPSPKTRKRISDAGQFNIHLMKPSEALEVSRSAYKTYGYTYPNAHIYYPDRMVELNEGGQLVSATAVTVDGELAGHCAIFRLDAGAQSAEIGQAVVKPEFRGQGCLLRLTEFLINEAKSRGMTGLYVHAVTSHAFSQRVATRLDFAACALLLGYVPTSVTFRDIKEELTQRETFLVQYKYLEKPGPLKLYSPSKHKDFIAKLYGNLGVTPRFEVPGKSQAAVLQSESILKTMTAASMPPGYASIEVLRSGENIGAEVKNALKEFRLKRYDVIALYLDLRDPLTFHLVPEFETLGFFFGGILPGASVGEALVLQYLNNVAIDYDAIKLDTEASREMLAYVKHQDPNRG
ncbi:MAG: GNAT family N-acetyltransferase [Deltaproteobacteria bacterium]|nr:GNAT family N-acetyltransferase [Deltaproteobacteria bacterium]